MPLKVQNKANVINSVTNLIIKILLKRSEISTKWSACTDSVHMPKDTETITRVQDNFKSTSRGSPSVQYVKLERIKESTEHGVPEWFWTWNS